LCSFLTLDRPFIVTGSSQPRRQLLGVKEE
jgi:hypothetical protein